MSTEEVIKYTEAACAEGDSFSWCHILGGRVVKTHHKCFWHGVLLVIGLVFPALVVGTVQASPLATVSD